MRFFHLSDLHIGKQLHYYNLREDQKHILGQIITYAEEIHPDAVIIAGDIYDKTVPSAEAVALFDDFLTQLSGIRPVIPVLVISGNHDSAERLQYAADILRDHEIYLAGFAPEDPDEYIANVTLKDAYGEVDFYLLPFFKPSYVKNIWDGKKPITYSEAVRRMIKREEIDYEGRRNVLISHQFYTGGGIETKTCDTEICDPENCDPEICVPETVSAGGIDQVDIEAVRYFDYVALGHLHGARSVGEPHIQYCGAPLKYSVNESQQIKSLAMIHLKEKGEKPEIVKLPLHPIRDVRKKRGLLQEILDNAKEEEKDDYISITITDETDPYKPKEQLEKVYTHILEVRADNTRTRQKLEESGEELQIKDPLSIFCDFYEEIQGKALTEEERRVIEETLEKAKGE